MRAPRHKAIVAVAVLFAVVAAAIVFASPKGVHWSPDCSAKFLAVKSLRYEGGFRYDVPYLGRTFDPALRGVPVGETYYDIRNGEIHISWPELFPILTFPFYRIFGWFGLFVLPVCCGALSIYLTGLIAEIIRPRTGWIAALVTAVGTPVIIYSTLFWEHTPALALMLVALLLSLRYVIDQKWWRVVLGSACVGLAAAGLRTDANTFFVALAGSLFLITRGRRRWLVPLLAASGFIAGAAPASALNWITNGKILAANTMKNAPPPSLTYLKQVGIGILPHFFAGTLVPARYAWLLLLAVAALVVTHYFVKGRARPFLLFLALTATLTASALALGDARTTHVNRVHGFLVMSPFLAIGLLFSLKKVSTEQRDGARFILLTSILLCVLNIAALSVAYPEGWTSDDNREWGPRYWLVIFPLLGILAGINYDVLFVDRSGAAKKILAFAATSLVAVSFAFELEGFVAIDEQNQFNTALKVALEQSGEATPVLTDLFFVSALAPDRFFSRPSFYIHHHQLDLFTDWFLAAVARGLIRFDFAMFGDPETNMFIEKPIGGWRFVVDGVDRALDMRLVHLHVERVEQINSPEH